jgi:hypothetical protein
VNHISQNIENVPVLWTQLYNDSCYQTANSWNFSHKYPLEL